VSLARKVAAIEGLVSRPQVNVTLQARPTSPDPDRIAALAVLEKEIGSEEAEFIAEEALSIWASWESVNKVKTLPSMRSEQRLRRAASAKRPWQPLDSGRSRRRGKRMKRA